MECSKNYHKTSPHVLKLEKAATEQASKTRYGATIDSYEKPHHKLSRSAPCLGAAASLNAQNVTVNSAQLNTGYMNWSPAPGDAAGYGGSGSSGWGLSDLQANFSGTATLTLNPNINTYAPGNDY